MKADLKKKWVKALRSGNYEQGEGSLKTTEDDGYTWYCCLGVLAEMCEGVVWDEQPVIVDSQYTESSLHYHTLEGDSNFLPEVLADSIKLEEGIDLKDLNYGSVQSHLSDMNDGLFSFNDIANWIEENL